MKKSTLKLGLIAVLLLFALIPSLILGVVGTLITISHSKTVRLNELVTVSLVKSGAVDAVFTGYVDSAAELSRMESVINNAEKNNNEAINELSAFANGSSDIMDVLILGLDGEVLSSTAGVQDRVFEHFSDGVLPSVSCMLSWEKYDGDAMYVSHVIKGTNNREIGYVVCVVSLGVDSSLTKALSGTYIDGKARLALVDRDGNALNFNGNSLTTKSTELNGAVKGHVAAIFNETADVNEQNSLERVRDAKVGRYNIVYGIIPHINDWRWVGVVESGGLTDFASSTNIMLGIASLAVFVLSALIAFAVISRFISNMQKMLKGMSNINTGESGSVRFDTKHDKSELGAIQRSFNDFMDEVYMNGERYRTIAALSDNMLFEWDFHKERMYVSDNVLAKFDLDIKSATLSNGRFLDSLMTPEFASKYKSDINTLLKNLGSYSSEYQLKSKSGANVWVSCKATCVSDRLGEPLRVIGVLTDIDNEKKLENQLSERASKDFLTQLYNKDTFDKKLSTALDRRGPNKIGMMFIDVDDFKFINDRYGHAVGDEVIRFVADTVRKKVESQDAGPKKEEDRDGFVGRYGGDEFVICYKKQEDIENLEQIAMDLIDELYLGYTTSDGMLINVRASIGISYCPTHTEDGKELVAFADTAMYFVKKNGKTNYHVYVPEDSASGEYVDPEFKN